MNTHTNLATTTFNLPSLSRIGRNLFFNDPFFKGFFDSFDEFSKDINFPKYNCIKTKDGIVIDLALAGYDKENLSVELTQDNVLIIKTLETTIDNSPENTFETSSDDENEYITRGIAARRFNIGFKIGPNSEIGKVTFKNGILSIPITTKKIKIQSKEIPIN
jgi:molecular chaperone IbpA